MSAGGTGNILRQLSSVTTNIHSVQRDGAQTERTRSSPAPFPSLLALAYTEGRAELRSHLCSAIMFRGRVQLCSPASSAALTGV